MALGNAARARTSRRRRDAVGRRAGRGGPNRADDFAFVHQLGRGGAHNPNGG